ncbi:MAG TPA: hypothetical protein VHU40_19635, partial [Polyangia bacterium]|nr:hypothetical protein [Polyangia bacterium]
HAPFARIDALSSWLDQREATATPGTIHALLTQVVDQTALICEDIGREILGPPRVQKVIAEMPATQTQTQTQTQSDSGSPRPRKTAKVEVQ